MGLEFFFQFYRVICLEFIHFYPECQFMILLLFRECSHLLTRSLLPGVRLPRKPVGLGVG